MLTNQCSISGLILDERYAYWNADGDLMRRAIDGTSPVQKVLSQLNTTRFAPAGNAIYFENGAGAIMKINNLPK
jgi:hypothetical protein